MSFRLRFEALEARDNPSGPDLLDPIAPTTSPDSPPPAADTDTSGSDTTVDGPGADGSDTGPVYF